MSTIMGFLKPRAGAIALFGEPVAGLAPETIARKGICLVPQGRRMFRTLTVQENLMVAAQRAKSGSKGWTFERVFGLFPRLKERHAQVAGSLSGGEQQMLAIGRALMGNPRVLLMDEPSEGLAPQIVAEVRRTIEQLKAEGLSIVLVEQNIKLTLDLADDVVIINTGAVVFRGAASELKINDSIVAQHLGVF
jgi:branched-chain amino acid transport system ATP-binding protein